MKNVTTKKEFVELFNSSNEVQELVFNIYNELNDFNNTKTNNNDAEENKKNECMCDNLFVRPIIWDNNMYDELELSIQLSPDDQDKFYDTVYGHRVDADIYRRSYRYSSNYAEYLLSSLDYKLVSSNIVRKIYRLENAHVLESNDAIFATVHDSHGSDEIKFFKISKIIAHITVLLMKIRLINISLEEEYDNIVSAAGDLECSEFYHNTVLEEIRRNILTYELHDNDDPYKTFNVINMSILPNHDNDSRDIFKYFYTVESNMRHTTDRYIIGVTSGINTKRFTASLMLSDEIYNILKVWFDNKKYYFHSYLYDILPFDLYILLDYDFRYSSTRQFDLMVHSD